MNTTALRIVELVKSLPPSQQRAVSAALVQMNLPALAARASTAGPFG